MAKTSHMFASVPAGRPSLRAAYEAWLKRRTPLGNAEPHSHPARRSGEPLSVGIVGAGMAGLYAALLLQKRGVNVHLFEAEPDRVGGRVYTASFFPEPHQYFEAGAMRLPEIPEQQPVFDLIEYLNERAAPSSRISVIPYVLYDTSGNRVYVNGRKQADGRIMTVDYANAHPDELGFPLPDSARGKKASDLLDKVLGPFLELLQKNFEQGFQKLLQYDNYSLHAYLAQVAGWDENTINYAEVMTSQTNQFQNSFTELVIENMDFSQAQWQTIDNGMTRLPNACAELIGAQNITKGAEVYRLEQLTDGRIGVYHSAAPTPVIFDKVLAALPPAALRMIQTPQWPVQTMQAIRAFHFEPLYKIGLRFQTRFWEKVTNPARGGQSITDLPSRWIVYPSYGIGEDGPGVLLLYTWMTDAYIWLPMSQQDRERIALRDLATVYPEVDVKGQFIESFNVAWPLKAPTGDAMFYPGQFASLFNIAQQSAGNVYFAGEHLSVNHTWIVGALDSALLACQQILGDADLQPLRPRSRLDLAPHTYDYSRCAEVEPLRPPRGEPLAARTPTSRRWRFE